MTKDLIHQGRKGDILAIKSRRSELVEVEVDRITNIKSRLI